MAALPAVSQHIPTSLPGKQAHASKKVALHWLDQKTPELIRGTTWGVPWNQGELKEKERFRLSDSSGNVAPLQSWPLAFWPDGSVKWSAHAAGKEMESFGELFLEKTEEEEGGAIQVSETNGNILVTTGAIAVRFLKEGQVIFDEMRIGDRIVAQNATSRLIIQDQPDTDMEQDTHKTVLTGKIIRTSLEQTGPVRTVVKVEGIHSNGQINLFPFILRFYLYSGSETIKVVHTFLYDADENSIFIKGLGLSFGVPFHEEETHNRHVRFSGERGGVFSEAVKGLTGLRRDPGEEVKNAQLQGRRTPSIDAFSEAIRKGLPYIPAFGDYTLAQLNAKGFDIRKRTKPGFSWLDAATGQRSGGTAYLGSPSGGLALSLRNFWQSYPGQMDIRNAGSAKGELTAWFWAPLAPAMDLRFYHDGMGQDTYEKQWEGLEITYEDYEPGYGSPHGVARTSELYVTAFEQTPSNESLAALADFAQKPPFLTVSPAYLFEKQVFGGNWSLPKRDDPVLAEMEDNLDQIFTFYKREVETRSWYGFWNYGDVMHGYDEDRHTWKYDVGGFAWDNSELSTDLWLWYYYLRTGRSDVFRLAEAMCRHTGEVDVYHLGRFAPLGSRHNVMHWGCSAKQLRISTAMNRRFYYYLTADERTGDLLKEQVEAVRRLEDVVALRKRLSEPLIEQEGKVYMSFGTDWGAVAAAWFTQWERTLDKTVLTRLTAGMNSIAQQPHGFFTGVGYFHVDTGRFDIAKDKRVNISHLNAAFGLVEICSEILTVIEHKAFEDAWINYCILYNAPPEERAKVLGTEEGKFNLRSSHARLTAYAASKLHNDQLSARAWSEFVDRTLENNRELKQIYPPVVLQEIKEWKNISTNWAAQWSLTAIQCIHYIGDKSIK